MLAVPLHGRAQRFASRGEILERVSAQEVLGCGLKALELAEYVNVARHAVEGIAAEGFGEVGEDHLLNVIGEGVEGRACTRHCGRLRARLEGGLSV